MGPGSKLRAEAVRDGRTLGMAPGIDR